MKATHGRSAISNRAICDPSRKMKTNAEDRKGPPGKVLPGKARLSPYVREDAASGLNMMRGVPTSFRSVTQTEPSGTSFRTPATVATTPGPEANTTCTFVDSVINLCSRSLASPSVMSAPVPREDIFLLLVKMCGVEEAIYWSELMGFEHRRSRALLSRLLYGER